MNTTFGKSLRYARNSMDYFGLFSGLQGNLLIKMDIEGNEFPIFKHIGSQRWIDRTYALIMEFHDNGTERAYVYDIMREKGFSHSTSGENVVFIKS